MAQRAVSGLTFGKIIQQVRSARERVSAHSFKVSLPGGFPYEAFNGKAYLRPWSILRMVECSRAAMFNEDTERDKYLDIGKIYQDYLLFNGSTSTNISPELYNFSTVKSPLEIRIKLDYVGNTTFKLKTDIYIEGSDKPLCENETQSVFVSTKTRQPAPPPDWWKQRFALGSENGQPLKLPRLTVPNDVILSEYLLRVPASDVDPYMHVNWTNYMKYCQDAFVYEAFEKSGSHGAENAIRNVKQFSISFINEANLGDMVNIRFWRNHNIPDLYHFQLLRESAVLGECSVEYYPIE